MQALKCSSSLSEICSLLDALGQDVISRLSGHQVFQDALTDIMANMTCDMTQARLCEQACVAQT
jgi:hypothetical protein